MTISAVFTLSLDAPSAGAARMRLAGHLDDAAARQVLHTAADIVKCGCSKLVLDLEELDSFDDDAAYAVVGCSQLARWLPDGVSVVAGSAAGSALVDTAGVAPVPTQEPSAGTMGPCPAY